MKENDNHKRQSNSKTDSNALTAKEILTYFNIKEIKFSHMSLLRYQKYGVISQPINKEIAVGRYSPAIYPKEVLIQIQIVQNLLSRSERKVSQEPKNERDTLPTQSLGFPMRLIELGKKAYYGKYGKFLAFLSAIETLKQFDFLHDSTPDLSEAIRNILKIIANNEIADGIQLPLGKFPINILSDGHITSELTKSKILFEISMENYDYFKLSEVSIYHKAYKQLLAILDSQAPKEEKNYQNPLYFTEWLIAYKAYANECYRLKSRI